MSDDPTQSTSQPVSWSPPAEPAPAATPPPSLEPVRPAAPTARRSSSGRWLNLLLVVAAAVAIGGVAFAIGRGTAPASAAAGFGAAFPGGSFDPTASGAPGRGLGAGFLGVGGLTVEGTVQSVSGDTLTITTDSGQTVEVSLGSDTEYHKQADGSSADVTTGSKVSVQLDLAGRGGANGGQSGNDAANGPAGTASDVTVMP